MDKDKADVVFEIHKYFVHEILCKFTPKIEANRNFSFCSHKFGWYLKVKVGLLKAKTLFTKGKRFFDFFSDQAVFDPWSLLDHRRCDSSQHSSRQRKRSRNHRLLLQQCTQHQTPSSSTASALKPTVCGSAITFLVNRAFRSCDQWDARITLGNYSASLRMCRLKSEFLINYTLCPCWKRHVNERQNLRHSQPRVVCGNFLGLWRLTLKNPYHLQTVTFKLS